MIDTVANTAVPVGEMPLKPGSDNRSEGGLTAAAVMMIVALCRKPSIDSSHARNVEVTVKGVCGCAAKLTVATESSPAAKTPPPSAVYELPLLPPRALIKPSTSAM